MYTEPKSAFDISIEKAAFKNWIEAANETDNVERTDLMKAMGKAIKNELTEKQLLYITKYFIEGMCMPEIGELYGVNKGTVSRTIKRGIRNLRRVMIYSSPRLLKQYAEHPAMERNIGMKQRRSKNLNF